MYKNWIDTVSLKDYNIDDLYIGNLYIEKKL